MRSSRHLQSLLHTSVRRSAAPLGANAVFSAHERKRMLFAAHDLAVLDLGEELENAAQMRKGRTYVRPSSHLKA